MGKMVMCGPGVGNRYRVPANVKTQTNSCGTLSIAWGHSPWAQSRGDPGHNPGFASEDPQVPVQVPVLKLTRKKTRTIKTPYH